MNESRRGKPWRLLPFLRRLLPFDIHATFIVQPQICLSLSTPL
jgi:hypothetical protein